MAATRLEAKFPLQYRIGAENMMFQGNEFAGAFDIIARISQRGTAGMAEAGDIEGRPTSGNPTAVGTTGADIVLDTVVQ